MANSHPCFLTYPSFYAQFCAFSTRFRTVHIFSDVVKRYQCFFSFQKWCVKAEYKHGINLPPFRKSSLPFRTTYFLTCVNLYKFMLEQTVAGFLGWDDKKTWAGQNVSTFLGASFPQQLHTEASAVQYNIHSPTDRTCSTNSCRLPRCLPWTKSKVTDFQSAA